MADDGVFNFDCLPNVAAVTNGCGASQVTVGADFAVFSDDNITFDDHSG